MAMTVPPRVTLCMILRDEHELLADCLRSARAVVGEIVALVDDRTTDDTIAIARNYGARVETFTWTDDFAAARNASIDRARGAWILVLDADDRLLPAGARAVRAASGLNATRIYSGQTVHGYMLEIEERTCGGRVLGRAPSSARLFPRSEELRYVGIVHEEVQCLPDPSATRWALIDGGPHIAHLGYDRRLFAERDKDDRNVRLLERRLVSEPYNPYVRYYLAKHHWWMGRAALAGHWARQALRPEMRPQLHAEHQAELVRLTNLLAGRAGITAP